MQRIVLSSKTFFNSVSDHYLETKSRKSPRNEVVFGKYRDMLLLHPSEAVVKRFQPQAWESLTVEPQFNEVPRDQRNWFVIPVHCEQSYFLPENLRGRTLSERASEHVIRVARARSEVLTASPLARAFRMSCSLIFIILPSSLRIFKQKIDCSQFIISSVRYIENLVVTNLR